jgi:hypothetical protein
MHIGSADGPRSFVVNGIVSALLASAPLGAILLIAGASVLITGLGCMSKRQLPLQHRRLIGRYTVLSFALLAIAAAIVVWFQISTSRPPPQTLRDQQVTVHDKRFLPGSQHLSPSDTAFH